MATHLRLLRRFLKLNQKDPDGFVLRGRVLLVQNKNAEAVAQLHEAVNFAPNSSEARYYLGLAQYQSGNHQAAENEWTQAAKNPGRFCSTRTGVGAIETGITKC